MNTHPISVSDPGGDDAEAFDRLIDGELGENERLRLLASLDGRRDGWKRLALGFLEAQALREAWEQQAARAPAPVPRGSGWSGLARAAALVLLAAGAGFGAATWRDRAAGLPQPALSGGEAVVGPLEVAVPVPVPVAQQGLVLEPALAGDGRLYYGTRQEVPPFIRRAVERAGHRVERDERVVELETPGGRSLQLPVAETRIYENPAL